MLFFIALPLLLVAAVPQATADSIGKVLNGGEVCGPSCSYYAGEHSAMGFWNTLFTFLLVVLGSIWLFSTYKKKFILLIGIVLGLAVAASYVYPEYFASKSVPVNCPVVSKDTAKSNVFYPPSDEFVRSNDTAQATNIKSAPPKTPATEEFQPASSSSDEFTQAETGTGKSDEFTSADVSTSDEFTSAETTTATSEFESAETATAPPAKTWQQYLRDPNIYEPIVIFLLVALISLLIKNATFRKFRGLFLLASVFYLGFYRGACPCMISSFQNSFLIFLGVKVKWETLLWFLMLIPGAYFFGKIWCGWLCHLGALQEFLYKAFNLHILQGRKAQRILKGINIGVFVLWIVQLILTRSNLFCEYDPFKVAYNLISPTTTGYVLLGILLVSSVLIYRPFCRTTCPVGLVLGWVSKIPGARHLIKEESCIDCKSCDKACEQRALIHEDKKTTLNVPDCILCGECISECKVKKSLNIACKK